MGVETRFARIRLVLARCSPACSRYFEIFVKARCSRVKLGKCIRFSQFVCRFRVLTRIMMVQAKTCLYKAFRTFIRVSSRCYAFTLRFFAFSRVSTGCLRFPCVVAVLTGWAPEARKAGTHQAPGTGEMKFHSRGSPTALGHKGLWRRWGHQRHKAPWADKAPRSTWRAPGTGHAKNEVSESRGSGNRAMLATRRAGCTLCTTGTLSAGDCVHWDTWRHRAHRAGSRHQHHARMHARRINGVMMRCALGAPRSAGDTSRPWWHQGHNGHNRFPSQPGTQGARSGHRASG